MSKYKPDGARPTPGDHDPLLECPSCACVYHPARRCRSHEPITGGEQTRKEPSSRVLARSERNKNDD
jgi:hypothetical protein